MPIKINPVKITLFISFLLVLSGCKVERHDYFYKIHNSTETTGAVKLLYQLKEDPEMKEKWLNPAETFEIYRREDVTGDGIWNIETSSLLYAIPSLTAYNSDETKMTEDLSARSYWPASPTEENKTGIYDLRITDDMFVMEKQWNYKYFVQNAMDDSLFVTSYLQGSSRQRDTLLAGEIFNIGETDIYSYTEDFQHTDKYKEKKLSGITSLILRYKENQITVNFNNYKSLNLEIGKDQTTLTVDNSIF